ncbi:regulatory protein, luxR family [Nonomuraea solani]|uniref:Regulatory protein, luxR family n=1 Tax=Nonomuraea solani TaxID=1144553 RepID=A0A1H6F2U7_9ACTN|nr:helix-turn-helix transcriptional regulator [Nonomuraea solani]SEH03264.1 regulatory protein, luxR family [Nonomuraea solani]
MLIGRASELTVLGAELARIEAGHRLLHVNGPAGIGKTTLVRHFLSESLVASLTARAAEEESGLPYGLLAQLVADGTGPELLQNLLRQVEDRPLVLVIDDAQWADGESLRALAFALRRLGSARLLTVIVTRSGTRLPTTFEHFLRDAHTVRLELPGLRPAELRELADALGTGPITARMAERLHAHTGGNPTHARALLARYPTDVLDSAVPLPAPPGYPVPALTPVARTLVEAASVLGVTAPLSLVAELADLTDPLPALDEAVAAGLLQERRTVGALGVHFPDRLRWAAVYHSLRPAARTLLHERATRLAGTEADTLWHRMQAATRPDARLAADLAGYARRQATNGHWTTAADHLAHATHLTPAPSLPAGGAGPACLLKAELVEALLADGRVEDAAALSAELADCPDPAVAAYAAGAVAHVADRLPEAVNLLTDAYEECGARQGDSSEPCGSWRADSSRLSGWAGTRLALLHLLDGRLAEGLEWARRVRTDLTGLLAFGATRHAAPLGRAVLQIWTDDLANGRHVLGGLAARAAELPVPARIAALVMLGQADHRLGDWAGAQAHAEAAAALADESGHAWLAGWAHATAAVVAAGQGEQARAEAHLRTTGTSALARVHLAWAQACLSHAQGDHGAVVAALMPLEATGRPPEPGVVPWPDLLAEALVALGRHERARAVLDRVQEVAEARQRHSALAALARARGVLHAALGEQETAEEWFETGLRHAGKVAMPFETARLQLAFGAFLRRAGRRTAAADLIELARTGFEQLGARPFEERCTQELAACGLNRRQDALGLTPQEQAVTRLVATGLTNNQVARELTLSVKTVEYHLSHAYTKLGVTSRTALAALVARGLP